VIYVKDFFKYLIRLAFFGCLIFIVSCGENEENVETECIECDSSSQIIETYDNRRVELGAFQGENSNSQDTVIMVDQMKDQPFRLGLCNRALVETLEVGKILEVSGDVKSKNCDLKIDNYDAFIELKSVDVVDHCLPVIDTIQSQNDLFGEWSFYKIQKGNEVYLPACESGEIGLTFTSDDNELELVMNFGNLGYSGLIDFNQEYLILSGSFSSILGFHKTSLEKRFFEAFRDLTDFQSEQSQLKWDIHENWLIITGQEKSDYIILYKTSN
jgi:hypothetical protein